ncbi:MAG: hypothetical protein KDD63_22740, partial [Bacteroidetes bacterium]|nr:hypothetical protein [Bacteroidota bacterium]
GSEAIVSALWKLDGGAQSWNNTVNHAYLAAQKKLFSENLYQHNAMDLERMAPVLDKALAELPVDEMGGKKFFSGSENSKVSMYASHPPNDQREASAKNPFIPCPTDERSPWILFSNVDGLQKEMTELIYKKYLGKSPEGYMDAEKFEAFIKAESHGKELMEAYANTFVSRYLNIPAEEEISVANIPDVGDPKAGAEKLKEDVKALMKPVEEIEAFMVKAQKVAEGTVTDKSIMYNGSTFEKKEMNALYQQLNADREKLFSESFKEWDTTFCVFHLALAKKKGREAELKNLYLQHEALIRFYKVASGIHNFVFTGLQQLQQNSELTETELIEFGQEVVKCGNTLNEELNKFDQLTFVPLPNVEDVGDLKAAIVDDGQFPKISG